MILISLAVITVISIIIITLILITYGNKQEEICQPIEMKNNDKLLSNSNGMFSPTLVLPEKKL
jgi:hypothetical protein